MRALYRIFVWLGGLVVALWPFWIWLAAYKLLAPNGFRPKLLVVGLGTWVLGGLQLLMLAVWFAVCLIFTED